MYTLNLNRCQSCKCNVHFLIITVFFYLPPTLINFHPLQVENCDSNSRLVVDENDNGKFRLERVLKDKQKRQKMTKNGCIRD